MLGIIGAMDTEVAKLKEMMQDVKITEAASMEFYEGTLNGAKAVVVRAGVGKVNAACCTQALIDHFPVSCVINRRLAIIPDMDTEAFLADEKLRKIAKESCKKVNPDINVYEGRIVTGDQFISSKEKKAWLTETFGGFCAEMEGAAIAHAAYLNHIPFLIVRAISDKADDSAQMDYPTFEAKAIEHSVRLIVEMAGRLS